MSVEMWNCHSWPLDVSNNISGDCISNLVFLTFGIYMLYWNSLYFPINWLFLNGLSLVTLNSKEFALCSGSFKWGVCQLYPSRGKSENLSSNEFYALLHRRSFRITYERPNEHFPIYLLGNTINVCWNCQNRVCFYEMINLRSHMPRFNWKINVFPFISLETPWTCVETLRTGLVFPRWSIWGVTWLGTFCHNLTKNDQ